MTRHGYHQQRSRRLTDLFIQSLWSEAFINGCGHPNHDRLYSHFCVGSGGQCSSLRRHHPKSIHAHGHQLLSLLSRCFRLDCPPIWYIITLYLIIYICSREIITYWNRAAEWLERLLATVSVGAGRNHLSAESPYCRNVNIYNYFLFVSFCCAASCHHKLWEITFAPSTPLLLKMICETSSTH